jgi:hypothetical protein
LKGTTLVDRRKDPNYQQVTGHVQKDLALQFKIFCMEQRITIAEGLEEAIALFLQSKGKAKAVQERQEQKAQERSP